MSIQQLFETVLTITDYPEKDRQRLNNEMLSLAAQSAILLYIEELPEEERNEIKELLEKKNQEEIEKRCQSYFTEESYKKFFAQEADRILGEYINDIVSELTEEQTKKLEEFLKSLS
jgi:uncharacterized membrane protein YheB (UPF0754 family)